MATPPLKPVPDGIDPGTSRGVITVGASQIGYREGPNNDTAFGVWYGFNHVAWCGEFVSWATATAGVPASVSPKYCYTPTGAQWFKARRQYWEGQDRQPVAGDIGFVYYRSLGRIGHTFLVERNLGNGYIQTIEGNTNDSGSSQGVGVFRLIRYVYDYISFGRPNYATSGHGSGGGYQEDDIMASLEEVEQLLKRYIGGPVGKDSQPVKGDTSWLKGRMTELATTARWSVVGDPITGAQYARVDGVIVHIPDPATLAALSAVSLVDPHTSALRTISQAEWDAIANTWIGIGHTFACPRGDGCLADLARSAS